MTLLAIPDIHGRADELDRVLRLADEIEGPSAKIVFLGDLTDRGPSSRDVIQRLIDGIAEGRDWTVLRGNHDQYFIDVMSDVLSGRDPGTTGEAWFRENIGGAETVRSYGVEAGPFETDWAAVARAVPQAHLEFMASLPLWFETEVQFFCHAGIRPGVDLSEQEPNDLIWIREPFLSDPRDHGKLVVHGHTSLEYPCHYGNRVNLDGGAGYGRPLCLARISGREVALLTETGPEPLLP